MYSVGCQPAPPRRDQAAVTGVGSGEGVNEPVYMWITLSTCSCSHSPADALAPHAGRLPFLFATPPPPHVRRPVSVRFLRRATGERRVRSLLVVELRSTRAITRCALKPSSRSCRYTASYFRERHSRSMNTLSKHRPRPSIEQRIPGRLQQSRERDTGELAALIGVEALGNTVAFQRLRQRRHAELGVHRVGQPPRQHAPTGPVHDRHQVQEPALHRDVG